MPIITLNNSHAFSYLSLQKPCEIDITPLFLSCIRGTQDTGRLNYFLKVMKAVAGLRAHPKHCVLRS